MELTLALAGIALALLVGAMSPGPSFVVVARTAVGRSRRAGLMAALGMGVGGAVFTGIALVGLYTLLESVGWLYAVAKVAGGVYLILMAMRIWRASRELLVMKAPGVTTSTSLTGSFAIGLTTQLSNPKTAIVYGSIFAALLPNDPPLWSFPVLVVLSFAIEAGWYALVAIALSSSRPRALYARWKAVVDRVAAAAICALGVRLVMTAGRTGG